MQYISQVQTSTGIELEKHFLRIVDHFGLLLEMLPELGSKNWTTKKTFLEHPYWRLGNSREVILQLSMSQVNLFLPIMLCLEVIGFQSGETLGVYTLELKRNLLGGVFTQVFVREDDVRLTPENVLFMFQTIAEAGAMCGIPRFEAYMFLKERS